MQHPFDKLVLPVDRSKVCCEGFTNGGTKAAKTIHRSIISFKFYQNPNNNIKRFNI